METTVNINGYESEGLMGVRIEQSNMNMFSDEEHFKSDDEFVSENGNSNRANLGSDSSLTENLTTSLSVKRSQSLQSIAASTVELMDNRSKSYADLHRMDDGAVDFSTKQHESYSEGKISSGQRSGSSEKCSAECRSRQELGSFGGSSPEHTLGPYEVASPEHRSLSNGEYPEGGSHVVLSPEHDSDSDGRISPKPAIDERVGNPPTSNRELREELDREMVEEEEDDNIKRIKDWINQIDINYDVMVEEPGESSESGSVSGPIVDKRSPIQTARGPIDPKASVGMAMAYNYISAMNPVTASAQLSNLGLVAVPILTAFAGLRELNLSGNNIFQITAGAIPKGIHVLNLSKNYISVIEGLKDLIKLRILDLSHNRISRIGHGLAACSSLRELYLAGNKISEVEGLHRLLKLKILDLRNNKLSTAKGLGQLAANYTSLEAISLDGNPAQRHVGDDHLKKYLLTLIPNLVYYNRHTIKSRGKKDAITMPSPNSRKSVGAGGSSLRSRSSSRSSTNYLLKASRSKNVKLPSCTLRFPDSSSRQVSAMNPLRRIQSTSAMGK